MRRNQSDSGVAGPLDELEQAVLTLLGTSPSKSEDELLRELAADRGAAMSEIEERLARLSLTGAMG
jgi:hypothetical protein